MTRILGSSGSAIVASRRVRRRQDDHGTARPAHPSLRHHRNRKRKLALQKPRLTPTGSPTGAHRLPPAHRYVRLAAVTPRCAGPPYGLHRRPSAGVNIARRSRVKVQCRLTMRKGFDGLAAAVQERMAQDPFCGHLFVFRGRRGDLIKVLWWDGQGLCLFAKRLEKGRFVWPSPADGKVVITSAQRGMLLEGIDWRMPRRTWRPELAG